MSKKFKLVRATVLALQIITVALRVHDAFCGRPLKLVKRSSPCSTGLSAIMTFESG